MSSIISEILVGIVRLVIAAVTGYITTVLVPEIVAWLKDKRLYTTVMRFVMAAEKMAESGQITKGEKLGRVEIALAAKGIEVDGIMRDMIEAAVMELDMSKEKILDAAKES